MEAVWGFIGTLIGALASIGATYVTARTAGAQQIASSERDRDEKNRTFQLTTLLTLQEEIVDILRLVARAHHDERIAFRAGVAWGRTILDNDLDESIRVSFRQISLLSARLVDGQLRQDVKLFVEITTRVNLSASENSAIYELSQAGDAGIDLMEKIGESLRKQY